MHSYLRCSRRAGMIQYQAPIVCFRVSPFVINRLVLICDSHQGLRYEYLLLRMIHNVDLPIVSHRDIEISTRLGLCAEIRTESSRKPKKLHSSQLPPNFASLPDEHCPHTGRELAHLFSIN